MRVAPATEQCRRCGDLNEVYLLRLIPTNMPELKGWPHYVPQIKVECQECGQYKHFAKQTPELIGRINQALSERGPIADY